ncbi:ArsR/SmtB family transcription factor [Methylobacterium sp. JK268]
MTDADLFRLLADPTRRALFERLTGAEMTVSELKAGSTVSQPAISQHLAALKGAGLVQERREGRFSFYRADPGALAPLVDWVDRYRTFWPERLQRLRDVVTRMD